MTGINALNRLIDLIDQLESVECTIEAKLLLRRSSRSDEDA
jgi:hypothetical protein